MDGRAAPEPNFLIKWRRAAAGALVVALTTVGALVATPGVALATTFSSFDAGVFAANQVKHVWWNNANSDVYAPGLHAVGADNPKLTCELEILRTWYQRNASGEREFHLQIKGDRQQRCQATVWLARLSMEQETETGELAAGQSRSWPRLNAHTDRNIYLVGAVASQPVSGACRIEMTAKYRTQPNGQTDFIYTATNTGDVTCSAKLRHTALTVDRTATTAPLSPPPGGHVRILAGMPADTKVVTAGAAPDPTSAGTCQITIGSMSYTAPPPHNVGVRTTYHNTGTVTCGLTATYATLR
jgi:hypothetical protein